MGGTAYAIPLSPEDAELNSKYFPQWASINDVDSIEQEGGHPKVILSVMIPMIFMESKKITI